LGGATRGETVLHVLIWEIYFNKSSDKKSLRQKILILTRKLYDIVEIQVCKNYGPLGVG
jgi:hypothetical protein